MDINNMQHLANLMAYLRAYNETSIILPPPDGSRNSTGDTGRYADTWGSEFAELRESDPRNTVSLDAPGAALYAYNMIIDGNPVHLIVMECDGCGPTSSYLDDDHCLTPRDLIDSWLGQTSLEDHPGDAIQVFAAMPACRPPRRGRPKARNYIKIGMADDRWSSAADWGTRVRCDEATFEEVNYLATHAPKHKGLTGNDSLELRLYDVNDNIIYRRSVEGIDSAARLGTP